MCERKLKATFNDVIFSNDLSQSVFERVDVVGNQEGKILFVRMCEEEEYEKKVLINVRYNHKLVVIQGKVYED